MDEERNWFVGVDWASETHHVCVLDVYGDKLGERGFTLDFAGTPAAVRMFCKSPQTWKPPVSADNWNAFYFWQR